MTVEEMRVQLASDVEAIEDFLLSALAQRDTRAVRVWQETLAGAKAALDAVTLYAKALTQ